MKKFTDQELNEALKAAPKVIQGEIATGYETADIIRAFKSKYNLHIDTLGMIAELTRNMLLGLVNPQEFLQELITSGVPDKDARGIMTEINQKIFVPLREEMRKGGREESAEVKHPQESEPAEVRPPQVPAAAEPPRAEPARVSASVLPPLTTIIPANPQLPARPAPMLTSVPRYVPPKKYFHLQNKIPTAPSPQPKLPSEGGQTSLNPAKLLEDHEEPHIDFHPPSLPLRQDYAGHSNATRTSSDTSQDAGKTPSSTAETPLRQALRTVLPRPFEASGVVGPPANLPGVMPPAIPQPPVVTTPPSLPIPPPRAVPPPAPARPYSSDPYREPVDEK
ncbi:MAG: hypothetical protein Q7R58_02885 [bacterium]|nr:hypothetical protein [bacterium]